MLAASSCTKVEIPNIRICAVSGIMAAGADCGYTLSDKSEQLTLTEFIEFLEPSAVPGKEKGAALCQSVEDFVKLKIALEQACAKSRACTEEVVEQLEAISRRIKKVSSKK